jgi:colanic acid/amylovoran biosynthesis glycosyltransferase
MTVRVGRAERGERVVAVLVPNRNAYSETFIRAHLERLPARVECLIANWFPHETADGRPLLETGIARRFARAVVRRALGWKQSKFHERAFRAFLRRHRVDVVLAEYGPTGVAVMETCRRARVPLVVHFHGFDAYEKATLQADGARYPEMSASAAAVVAVSRHMERRLLELGAPRERLFYNPYGADVDAFVPGHPDQAPPLFVAVGRFVEKKAPHLTLLAFAEVARQRPDARLVMAGDGALLDACRQLAGALGIRDRVEFPGAVPHHDVARLMGGARAFVQHSVTAPSGDSEGTPVGVIEASASGLPVVATRHGGIPDVVIDGETGLLVEEGDVAGMAERMLRLVDDPPLAARLGAAGRARVIESFSMERSIAGLWDILARASGVDGRGGSR